MLDDMLPGVQTWKGGWEHWEVDSRSKVDNGITSIITAWLLYASLRRCQHRRDRMRKRLDRSTGLL